MLKILISGLMLAAAAGPAIAQYGYGSNRNSVYGTGSNPSGSYHSGYTTQRGTYVAPHYQTNPNTTQFDNYGSRGNLNPYTGTYGTRSPRY